MRDASTMDRPVDNRRRKTVRRAVLAGAALLLVLVTVAAYPSFRRWSLSEASVDASRIRLGEAARGDLVRDVSIQGNVVAAFQPTLISPARGIVRGEVKAGTVVAPGQVLARIESPETESRLEQERSTLVSLQADLERQRILAKQAEAQSRQNVGLLEVELEAAERAKRRAEDSRREGLLNAVLYEKALDDVRIARLKLDLARQRAEFDAETQAFEIRDRASRVERQRLIAEELLRQVGELAIRSPVAGLVSRVLINDRDSVTAGQPLITVVDLSAFEIEVAVPENYADDLALGTEAVILYDGRDYRGTLKSVAPVVEGSRVRGVVAFSGEAPEGLKQNQRLTTRLILETRPDVIKVPRGPFLESGGGRSAYVLDDGTAVLRPIEVGALSVSEVEIVSGLEIGDHIILSDTTRFEGAERILLRR